MGGQGPTNFGHPGQHMQQPSHHGGQSGQYPGQGQPSNMGGQGGYRKPQTADVA